MTGADLALLLVAGFAAGTVNGAAGGGSLVSFPALLATGQGAVTANVTSTVGILSGYLGGVVGHRAELHDQGDRVRALLPVSVSGAAVGAAALLLTPEGAFDVAAPWLILAACALFTVQPRLARHLAARRRTGRGDAPPPGDGPAPGPSGALQAATFGAAAYGAYFGAGLGVILLAVLGLGLEDSLIRLNGVRGVLALVVNVVATATFVAIAPVAWAAAGVLAISALGGGWIGARAARRLPPPVLRGLVITFGAIAGVRLLVTG
ncbi:sulfite exporter TauE/SafE family protein [Iamia sp. SCSIO 61187]|uniref:sulfite exporter TauE/SafE family protein n=1 Tax=Iamia sp. SCSIO 61187 TaxID=2722752 RepID=UPI001C630B88|nr:sulfite exporter TauE/SafE family protein [Iamia sp. SCSIO 61187]QYG94053.1 sulfite exporter TauE/SafE family protein [Iamia sp. SCSIO 61187]